jgi:hypothetical protein
VKIPCKWYVNITEDEQGRHPGLVDGYQERHMMKLVYRAELEVWGDEEPEQVGDRMFAIGNGHAVRRCDLSLVDGYPHETEPDTSVGDILVVGEVDLAVEPCGFKSVHGMFVKS